MTKKQLVTKIKRLARQHHLSVEEVRAMALSVSTERYRAESELRHAVGRMLMSFFNGEDKVGASDCMNARGAAKATLDLVNKIVAEKRREYKLDDHPKFD